jgi:hypothetical protein
MTDRGGARRLGSMKTYLAALALATAVPVPAAQSTANVLACADIVDSGARLECFDRSAATARSARTPAPAPVTPPQPAPQPPVSEAPVSTDSPASSFGAEGLKRNKPAADEATLQSRIAETRRSGGGLYLITLENGQIWRHETGSMAPYLLAGEAVTIRKASLGSYRLTLDSGRSKNWVRVTRIR